MRGLDCRRRQRVIVVKDTDGTEEVAYFFHLYADDLLAALDDHVLATGTLVGIFGR